MDPLEKGEIYRGQAGVLRDSNWLTSENLDPTKDTEVQIEAVIKRSQVVFKDSKRQNYGSLRLRGMEKELGLNSSNLAVLKALFGSNTAAWFGKTIALYVTEVSAFGKTVPAIRIRARKIEPQKEETK